MKLKSDPGKWPPFSECLLSNSPPSASNRHLELVSSLATFIVIGKTGVGESSFIKSLGGKSIDDGQEPTVDEGIDSCESSIAFLFQCF